MQLNVIYIYIYTHTHAVVSTCVYKEYMEANYNTCCLHLCFVLILKSSSLNVTITFIKKILITNKLPLESSKLTRDPICFADPFFDVLVEPLIRLVKALN